MKTSVLALAADKPVPYPKDDRDWRHVKSMAIQKGHPLHESFGGIHPLYALTERDDVFSAPRAGE